MNNNNHLKNSDECIADVDIKMAIQTSDQLQSQQNNTSVLTYKLATYNKLSRRLWISAQMSTSFQVTDSIVPDPVILKIT